MAAHLSRESSQRNHGDLVVTSQQAKQFGAKSRFFNPRKPYVVYYAEMLSRHLMSLRVTRALACSLAMHGLAWALLREWPTESVHATAMPVELHAHWAEPEPTQYIAEPLNTHAPEWIPLLLDAPCEADPPHVEPPVIEIPTLDPPVDSEEKPLPAPYWEDVRADLARALKWPAGVRAPTNIEVRILATRDGLIPMAPPTGESDPVRVAVRRAVEHVARTAVQPPEDLIGQGMRLTIRFESEP
jgi:hypothetical protein